MTGVVFKSTGSSYTVKSTCGKFYNCKIKGIFRVSGITSTNPIAVGDIVDFELLNEGDFVSGLIYNIHNRNNYIVRKSVNLSKQIHIIASNIDCAFLIVTIKNPKTFLSFIDRFLATSQAYGVETILLFNKIDIYNTNEIELVNNLIDLYSKVGYRCLKISALKDKNIHLLRKLMKNKTCLVSGHSGVGKSTLLNSLQPDLNLSTSDLTKQHNQGQHTTTFAEMYELDSGIRIIDTPGIKGFGIVNMKKNEIGDYFPEIFKIKINCKFKNCTHVDEPKCAVKKAVLSKEIAVSRYENYLQMFLDSGDNFRNKIIK